MKKKKKKLKKTTSKNQRKIKKKVIVDVRDTSTDVIEDQILEGFGIK